MSGGIQDFISRHKTGVIISLASLGIMIGMWNDFLNPQLYNASLVNYTFNIIHDSNLCFHSCKFEHNNYENKFIELIMD